MAAAAKQFMAIWIVNLLVAAQAIAAVEQLAANSRLDTPQLPSSPNSRGLSSHTQSQHLRRHLQQARNPAEPPASLTGPQEAAAAATAPLLGSDAQVAAVPAGVAAATAEPAPTAAFQAANSTISTDDEDHSDPSLGNDSDVGPEAVSKAALPTPDSLRGHRHTTDSSNSSSGGEGSSHHRSSSIYMKERGGADSSNNSSSSSSLSASSEDNARHSMVNTRDTSNYCNRPIQMATNVPSVGPDNAVGYAVSAGLNCASRSTPLNTLGGRCKITCDKPEDLRRVVITDVNIAAAPAVLYKAQQADTMAAEQQAGQAGPGSTDKVAGSSSSNGLDDTDMVDPVHCELTVAEAPLKAECRLEVFAVCC